MWNRAIVIEYADRAQAARLAEKVQQRIHVMHMQVKRGVPGEAAIKQPLIPAPGRRDRKAGKFGIFDVPVLTAVYQFFDFRVCRPEAQALADRKELSGFPHFFQHRLRAVHIERQRLFAEDMIPGVKRFNGKFDMQIGRQANIHDLKTARLQHGVIVGKFSNRVKINLPGGRFDVSARVKAGDIQRLRANIAHRRNFGMLKLTVNSKMGFPHKTNANNRNTHHKFFNESPQTQTSQVLKTCEVWLLHLHNSLHGFNDF